MQSSICLSFSLSWGFEKLVYYMAMTHEAGAKNYALRELSFTASSFYYAKHPLIVGKRMWIKAYSSKKILILAIKDHQNLIPCLIRNITN